MLSKQTICVAIMLLLSVIPLRAAPPEAIQLAREYEDMLRADLIVRGKVGAVTNESVPAELLEPTWTHGGECKIAVVDFAINEVVFGSFEAETIAFVVDMSNSELQGSYGAGDEMIVSLVFRPGFRGGTYFVNANEARFVLSDGAWIRQGHVTAEHRFNLEEIRSIVAPSRLEEVATSASIVAVGVVVAVEDNLVQGPAGGVGRIKAITLNVEELVKGTVASKTLIFDVFAGGTYWPSWADAGPHQIQNGVRYCVFLKEIEGKFYSAGGVNGFFIVHENQLMRNDLALPATIERIRVMLEE
jgi:hypothetical protein